MKATFPILLASLLIFASCGSGDSGDCETYCQIMRDTKRNDEARGCFGEWICYVREKSDTEGFCFERKIRTFKDENTGQTVHMCYKTKEDEPSWVAEKAAGVDAENIFNAGDYTSCLDHCQINTQGDRMPKNLLDKLYKAKTCTDFLEAELQHQCDIDAKERVVR